MSGGFMFPQVLEEEQKPETGALAKHKEDAHLRGTRAVTGYKLHATDGSIGHVEDYIIDAGKWLIRYLVVDASLWLPGRKVLISPDWIKTVSWDTSEVFVDRSRAEVNNRPEFDPSKPVNENYDNALNNHYRRPKPEEKINPDALKVS